MFKEVLEKVKGYAIGFVLGAFVLMCFTFFSARGVSQNIDARLSELEAVTKQVHESQREIGAGLESVRNSIDGARKSVSDLGAGIGRIEKINRDNLEAVGKLIIGNRNAQEGKQELDRIAKDLGDILDEIESKRQKP